MESCRQTRGRVWTGMTDQPQQTGSAKGLGPAHRNTPDAIGTVHAVRGRRPARAVGEAAGHDPQEKDVRTQPIVMSHRARGCTKW
jgi:hypothetical protein